MLSSLFVTDYIPFTWLTPGSKRLEVGMFHYRYTPYRVETLHRFWLMMRVYRFTCDIPLVATHIERCVDPYMQHDYPDSMGPVYDMDDPRR